MPLDKKTDRNVSVLFIAPGPLGISPGQRFRFEHYLPLLSEMQIKYEIHNFFSLKGWKTIHAPGRYFKKIILVLKGFFKLFWCLFRIPKFNYVYIYREVAPVGPPIFEWIISKILRKKIVYDFDDAIWIPIKSEFNSLARFLKFYRKTGAICKWSYKISVGNEFLAAYARQFASRVTIIPTVVDTVNVHNLIQNQATDQPVIGWTGTYSTLKYLKVILPVLKRLESRFDFEFALIADKDPVLPLRKYRFTRWDGKTEINDLMQMHIGVMPLFDDEISKGKCGFKAIQYMALGIPAVVSPVGVNSQIVEDGINGFVCNNEAEWETKLADLLEKPELRSGMGAAAIQKIQRDYSVIATRNKFLDLFS